MDVKFNSKKLTAIEYPGTVLNVDNMIKTLGSETDMWSTFNHPTRRLELKFRPGDAHCKCVYGDRFKTTNILLKVIKRTKTHSKNSNSNVEPDSIYKLEFLGVASNSYKFQSLADFQVLPIVFDKQQNEYKSLLPDIVPKDLHPLSWLEQEVELFVSPLMYSRFDVPQNGYLETNRGKNTPNILPENIIGKCRKRRAGFTVILTFESKETPEKPQDIALKQLATHPLDFELKFKVDEYFKERPIWSKNALLYRFGCEKPRLKYSLPCSAYYFNSGPWRTLWTKFGYDPRKTPSSKQYQVMDLRINANISLNENKIAPRCKNFALSNKSFNLQRSATINPNFLVPATPSENIPNKDEQKTKLLLCEYFPGELLPARQCFYQLCDIHLESVQALIHQNDGHEEICHEKDGWCELGTLEKCRELIIADIMKTNKVKEELEKGTD